MSKNATSVSLRPPLRKELDELASEYNVTVGSLIRMGAALVVTAAKPLRNEVLLACGGSVSGVSMGKHVSSALSLANASE